MVTVLTTGTYSIDALYLVPHGRDWDLSPPPFVSPAVF